ncbi:unnamed protein product [Angiostrongylus costaricensis]|uniref:Transmembrane protein 186 n=1 Tax=Angiostrongylus costaricensis TaxID=334426 RepID=A0A0R3PKJ1_ANGCS|nr:unnamed protein product [Angiostrongylus costaricensis]
MVLYVISFRIAVYRYPGIRFAVLLARAKVIQTAFAILYLPYSSYQFSMGHIDTVFFYSSAILAVIAPITLAVFSRQVLLFDRLVRVFIEYLNRLVGVISMNESNDSVRVGYLTYLDVADVLPLSEVAANKNDTLVKFSWFGGISETITMYFRSSFLYLPIKNVEIIDIKRAKILFGDLSFFRRP